MIDRKLFVYFVLGTLCICFSPINLAAQERGTTSMGATDLTGSTLIVDEIPGLIHDNRDYPPGRLLHLAENGEVIFETNMLKMPYDAVRMDDGSYWVSLIRENALWRISQDSETLAVIAVGGYPCAFEVLPNGNILVAGWDDDVPGFVKEFSPSGEVVWQMTNLKWPWKAQRLENGNTLIADAGTNRVYEVNGEKQEVWAIENLGPEENELFDGLGPVYVQRISNGNTLVSVRATNQILEFDASGAVVWEVGSELVSAPYSAVRLESGNTLIADTGNSRVIEIDVNKKIVWRKDGLGYPAKAYREE